MTRHRLAGDASMARVPLRASQHGRPSSGCQRLSVAAAPVPPKRDFVRKWSVHWNDVRATIFDPGDEPKRVSDRLSVDNVGVSSDTRVYRGD